MTCKNPALDETEVIDSIIEFIDTASGLTILENTSEHITICQTTDNKVLKLEKIHIEKVIARVDSMGSPFMQVNFCIEKKLLLTDTLVGFKPAPKIGLDMQNLPKVVTTPDLIGVIEALEDSLSKEVEGDDIECLRLLFYSVIEGAENIGFNLKNEKQWLKQINRSHPMATA